MASNANVADSCHVNTSRNGHRNNKGDMDLSRLSCLVRTAGIVKVFLPVQRAGITSTQRSEQWELCVAKMKYSEYSNSSATVEAS